MFRPHHTRHGAVALRLTAMLLSACGGGVEALHSPPVNRMGPEGGSIVAGGGRITLSVPPGALTQPTDLQIDTASVADQPASLPATQFLLGPATVTFLHSATATIRYDTGLDPGRESSVGVYADSSGLWRVLPASVADFAMRSVSAPINGSGRYALLALGRVTKATVSPSSVMVVIGTTQQLVCDLQDSLGNFVDNRPITWTSADTTIAQVNGLGRVFPISLGTTAVIATSGGGRDSSTVTVAFSCKCPVTPVASRTGTTSSACACAAP